MKLCYSLAQDAEETRINLIQNKIKLPNPSISGAPLLVINELSGISSSETSGAIDFFSFRKQDRGGLGLPDPNVSITERCWKLLPGVETLFWSRIALLNANKLKPPVRPSPADIHRSALWQEGSHKWLKKKKERQNFRIWHVYTEKGACAADALRRWETMVGLCLSRAWVQHCSYAQPPGFWFGEAQALFSYKRAGRASWVPCYPLCSL